jgi:hypothetical protein
MSTKVKATIIFIRPPPSIVLIARYPESEREKQGNAERSRESRESRKSREGREGRKIKSKNKVKICNLGFDFDFIFPRTPCISCTSCFSLKKMLTTFF